MYQPYPGGAQMPETQRPPDPASVLNAVKVMYAGAVASLVYAIIFIATLSATRSTIEKHFPQLTASQVNGQANTAPVKIFWFVVWLVGLAAVVFLWRGTSSASFKATRP